MRVLNRFVRFTALASLVLLASCTKELIGGLNQKDMLDAQLILERSGVQVTVIKGEDGRYALAGSASDSTKMLSLLADHGLPRDEHASVAQIFPGTGFVVTPFEQKARMGYALEQQLSQTLSEIEGVAEARVHVVLPEDNGRGLIREQSRASVLIKYRDDADLATIESKSRSLVVNSVRGLSYEDVSVVSSPALPFANEVVGQAGLFAPDAPAMGADGERSGPWSSRMLMIGFAALLAAGAAAILLLPQRRQAA